VRWQAGGLPYFQIHRCGFSVLPEQGIQVHAHADYQTIADLAGSGLLTSEHISEAIQYRSLTTTISKLGTDESVVRHFLSPSRPQLLSRSRSATVDTTSIRNPSGCSGTLATRALTLTPADVSPCQNEELRTQSQRISSSGSTRL